MQTSGTSHNPDQAYRNNCGAPFIDLIFRMADWYLLARQRQAARHLARLLGASRQKKVEIFRKSTLSLAAGTARPQSLGGDGLVSSGK